MVQRSSIHQVAHVATLKDTVVTTEDAFGEGRLTPLNIIRESLTDAVTESIKIATGQMFSGELTKYVGGITNLILGKPREADALLKDVDQKYRNVLNDIGVRTATDLVSGLKLGAPVNTAIDSLIRTGKVSNKDELIDHYAPNLRVFMKDGGVKKLANGEYKNAKDVASLLTTITGNTEIAKAFDLTAQFSILNAVLIRARKLGIDRVLDVVLDEIQDDKDKQKFLLEGVAQAASECDLPYVNKVIEEVGKTAVLSQTPDIIDRILTGYSDKVDFNATIQLCDSLSPNWDKVNRNGTMVNNLAVYATANSIVLGKMLVDDRFKACAAIVADFPANTLDGICKDMYQYSPF